MIRILTPALFILASCKGGENKANQSPEDLPQQKDSVITSLPATPVAQDTTKDNRVIAGQSRGIELTDTQDILANIEKHLTSAAQFRAVPGGGISDCLITVTNTLPDATFQKVMIEVRIKKDVSTVLKREYYTLVNIGPGMSKVIKVPNYHLGSLVEASVLKVKSPELTNGEWVLASM